MALGAEPARSVAASLAVDRLAPGPGLSGAKLAAGRHLLFTVTLPRWLRCKGRGKPWLVGGHICKHMNILIFRSVACKRIRLDMIH